MSTFGVSSYDTDNDMNMIYDFFVYPSFKLIDYCICFETASQILADGTSFNKGNKYVCLS